MKRFYFALIAIGIAIAGSAFTSTSPKHLAAFNYTLDAVGEYKLNPNPIDESGCRNTLDNPCWVGFTASQGSSFPSADLPSKSPTEISPANGSYVAP